MPKLVSVSDIMAKKLITLAPDDDITSAMALFLKHKISGAPVLEKGKLVGVLSEKDCMRLLMNAYFDPTSMGKVGDLMSTEVTTIPPTTTLAQVAGIFLDNPFRRLPVVDGDTLVGQVSRRDVLVAIYAAVTRDDREFTDPRRRGSMITDNLAPEPVGPATNRKWL